MERQGHGAYPYARIFAILQISHELLTLGITASQRDVFYRRAFPGASRQYNNCDSMPTCQLIAFMPCSIYSILHCSVLDGIDA